MASPHRIRSSVIGVVALTTLSLALPATAFASSHVADVAQPKVLSVPKLPAGSRVVASTPSSERITAGVFLAPRSASALASYAASVSNVHSKMFRHYLARGQFASRFGPTEATVLRVESALRSEGLAVAGVSSNHLVVTVVGTAARFESAFRTQLTQVRLASGVVRRATTAPVVVPASIARFVVDVFGLDNLLVPQSFLHPVSGLRRPTERGEGHSFTTRPKLIAGAPSACPEAQQATREGFGGITDDQIASAYGMDGLYSASDLGAGQTVAIFELEPFWISNVATFDTCYFGSSHTSQVRVIKVDGGPGSGIGSGEAALDVENVSAFAPSAKINVYEAPLTNYGWVDDYNQIVADDTAQEISTSWGFCEQGFLDTTPDQLATENEIFEQAAAQGQTVFAAAGDLGNDDCGNTPPETPLRSVDDPASQPYVVGVGGTTAINVNQPPAQQVWNDGAYGGAGGGGISTLWTMPAWQRPLAASQSNRTACNAPTGEDCRTVPDVTGFADELTGITIYYGDSWITIGGTSSSAPMWAAMLAEINASATCQASASTANGVGFASPLLYDVANNPTDYASGFTDVTLGNNDILNDSGGSFAAHAGYDLASGLGSPELTAAEGVSGPGLAQSLCAAAQGATTATIATLTPSSGAVGGGTPFTITGTGFFSGGSPDVSDVDFGTSAANFTVVSNTKITGTTTGDTSTSNTTLDGLTSKTGSVLVTITTSDNSVALGPTYHYVAQVGGLTKPVVYQLGPTGGRGSGGTKVNIYGTGFTGATKVTFGGKTATFTVRSDTQIVATAPSDTGVSCRSGDAVTQGLCQSQVVVTGAGGASSTVAAKKPYSGQLQYNELGELVAPQNCACEVYPTITEYDFASELTLTKVVGPDGTAYEQDPDGGDAIDLVGKGFNVLTFNWVNLGPAGSEASTEGADPLSISATGKTLQFLSFGDPDPTDTGNSVPVSVDTLGGLTDAKSLAFGPVQQVNSLSTDVLTSSGGTSFVINGGGFVGVQQIIFAPTSYYTPPVYVLSNFTVNSSTKITLPSPSLPPGSYQIYVCGEFDCGSGISADQADYTVAANYPGDLVVTSSEVEGTTTVPKGVVTGGTQFELQGTNFGPLGDLSVEFYNSYGEDVTTTAVVAGPSSGLNPGATESILVTTPEALGGFPDTDLVVLSTSDSAFGATSPQTYAALFIYYR
jgi:hypothetical protein